MGVGPIRTVFTVYCADRLLGPTMRPQWAFRMVRTVRAVLSHIYKYIYIYASIQAYGLIVQVTSWGHLLVHLSGPSK